MVLALGQVDVHNFPETAEDVKNDTYHYAMSKTVDLDRAKMKIHFVPSVLIAPQVVKILPIGRRWKKHVCCTMEWVGGNEI